MGVASHINAIVIVGVAPRDSRPYPLSFWHGVRYPTWSLFTTPCWLQHAHMDHFWQWGGAILVHPGWFYSGPNFLWHHLAFCHNTASDRKLVGGLGTKDLFLIQSNGKAIQNVWELEDDFNRQKRKKFKMSKKERSNNHKMAKINPVLFWWLAAVPLFFVGCRWQWPQTPCQWRGWAPLSARNQTGVGGSSPYSWMKRRGTAIV